MIDYDNAEALSFTKDIINAQGFGTLHAWLLDPNPYKHAQLVFDHFQMDKKPPRMIYDIGCGTGEMLFQAGERYHGAYLYGLNRFKSQVSPKTPAVEIHEGDFENYGGLDRKTFDLIMCNYTLGHFEHPDAAIMKMFSMLNRAGKLCMYDICRRSVLYDGIYGYHLHSQSELATYMSLFRNWDIWVPQNVTISPLLEQGVAHDFMTKTLPVFIIGEK